MATISRAAADIANAIQTDTEAHVTVDSVGSGTHALYGSTGDLGSNPVSWEASATQIATGVSGSQTYAWTGRTPDTEYHFAVVTTDGTKSLSNRISFSTALPRPKATDITGRTASTARVTWDDQSGGTAQHLMLFRELDGAASTLITGGVIPASQGLDFTFTDLATSTNYAYAAAAWDGGERISGLALVRDTDAWEGVSLLDTVAASTLSGDNARAITDFVDFSEALSEVMGFKPSISDTVALSDRPGGVDIIVGTGDLTERIRFNENFTVSLTQCADPDVIVFTDSVFAGSPAAELFLILDNVFEILLIGGTGLTAFPADQLTFSDSVPVGAAGVGLGERMLLADDTSYTGSYNVNPTDSIRLIDGATIPLVFFIEEDAEVVSNRRWSHVAANRF